MTEKIRRDFKVGDKFDLFNPSVKMASHKNYTIQPIGIDGSASLRIDDPKLIGQVTNMCRYCGIEGSKFRCGKCEKALYCRQKCQVYDWKMAEHKLICNKN